LKTKPTSVSVSRDSKYILVNLEEGQIQLIDIETTEVVGHFRGQRQGKFVIRSGFGGAGENFIVSGSEGKDSKLQLCPVSPADCSQILESISGIEETPF
jgi:WD repeat-containing protein 26